MKVILAILAIALILLFVAYCIDALAKFLRNKVLTKRRFISLPKKSALLIYDIAENAKFKNFKQLFGLFDCDLDEAWITEEDRLDFCEDRGRLASGGATIFLEKIDEERPAYHDNLNIVKVYLVNFNSQKPYGEKEVCVRKKALTDKSESAMADLRKVIVRQTKIYY